MFDFDGAEALVMTAGGVGMAFLVLALLMLLTSVMSWASRPWIPKEPQEPSPEQSQAEVAAAVAVSVAVAERRQRRPRFGAPAGGAARSAASGWALRGRQEIMDSRLDSGRR